MEKWMEKEIEEREETEGRRHECTNDTGPGPLCPTS